MYAGEIVEDAPAEDVYRRPRHPYAHGLLRAFPPLHGPRRELGGIPGSPKPSRRGSSRATCTPAASCPLS